MSVCLLRVKLIYKNERAEYVRKLSKQKPVFETKYWPNKNISMAVL